MNDKKVGGTGVPRDKIHHMPMKKSSSSTEVATRRCLYIENVFASRLPVDKNHRISSVRPRRDGNNTQGTEMDSQIQRRQERQDPSGYHDPIRMQINPSDPGGPVHTRPII